MKWCLDMPNLNNVDLSSKWAFYYKNDVTITGSTHLIPLSSIDIGALRRFFNWSSRHVWYLPLSVLYATPLSTNRLQRCEVVSDPNERRALFILSSHSELTIELETIHIINTLFDRVEKNRIRFREGNETSHFTLLVWVTCLHRPFYWRSHSSRSRQIYCNSVSKCVTLLHCILKATPH